MYSNKTSWIVIIVFILTGVAVSTCAHAEPYLIVSVGNGHTDRTTGTSGDSAAWVQSCCDSVSNNESGVWSLGLGYDWSYFKVEARYHEAGSYSQFGSWRYTDNGESIGTTMYGYGHIRVTGTSVAGIARYRMNDLSLGLEAGIWRWQARWVEHVVNAGSIDFQQYGTVKTSGFSPIVGAILGYKTFELRYEVLHAEPRDGDFRAVRELSLAYRVPF